MFRQERCPFMQCVKYLRQISTKQSKINIKDIDGSPEGRAWSAINFIKKCRKEHKKHQKNKMLPHRDPTDDGFTAPTLVIDTI